jgi:CO/xanthine dehydrogenase Mo-binding subunit
VFVNDVAIKNSYYGKIIRSDRAKGRIKEIVFPPNDKYWTLIQARDIPGKNRLPGSNVPVLTDGDVSYIGEAVAILAGPDKIKLERAASEIKIIFEDDGESSSEDAPVFFINSHNAKIAAQKLMAIDAPGRSVQTEDNTEDKKEPLRIETRCKTAIQEHWYSEPHGAVVKISKDTLIIYTATQWPEHVRESVTRVLNIPKETVKIELCETGIHLDGKIWYPSLVAAQAALASYVTQKPVKIMFNREEDFAFSPKRIETDILFSTVFDSENEALETIVEIKTGLGAETFFADVMLDSIASAVSSSYKLGQIKLSAEALRTNLPPAGQFAGFGAAQGSFALERHIANVCDTMQLDSSEWRKNHFNNKKIPQVLENEFFGTLISQSDYKRKWAAYELLRRREKKAQEKTSPMRGIGIAFASSHPPYHFKLDDTGGIVVDYKKNNENAFAVTVTEVEIDPVDFCAKIRGIWIRVSMGRLKDHRNLRRTLLQNLVGAIGWSSSEDIKYENGSIESSKCGSYLIPPLSSLPPISIAITERDYEEDDPAIIDELPYCSFPASYLQALTQACDYTFTSIPVSPFDIWQVLGEKEQIVQGEKEE